MIIFLYGEDSFRSRQKLRELRDKFTREIDPNKNNLTILNGKSVDIKEINNSIGTRSLLAKKRMIIIEDIFLNKNKTIFKEVYDYLKKIKLGQDDNIIVFWEERIKTKKTGSKKNILIIDSSGKENALSKDLKSLFDFLAKQSYTQEFKLLSNREITTWIKKQAKAGGAVISNQAAQILISLTGNNLWQINNELNKLINYKAGNKKTKIIEEEDIKQLVRGNFDENIFALTDAISNRRKDLALKLLKEQYEAGLTDSYLVNMIIRQFKILLQIRQALDSRFTSQKIISSLKLHPFVVQKSVNQVRNFSLLNLKNILNKLIEIDYLIKTGQGEAKILLNLFIHKI